ncbi:Replication protein A 70 kDa DNA-binding subunit A [Cardamine amara subsp. amara]|uniref:Replication protein A 70 kDa DNA-binding subunit A n=1 Tax=Cardamine amara subsp. amara TaxID=228776 RepID=A0ABD1BT70_CARAN
MAPSAASAKPASPKTFDDLDGDFCKDEVLVRLIHFWEARNHTRGNALLGIELLFIDTKSTTMQGFIPANSIFRYEDSLKRNALYKLKNFIINPRKKVYRVSDHKSAIFFTNQTSLDEITNGDQTLDLQKFRIRPYNDFAAIADQNGDLYDVIGQIRLITGDNLHTPTSLAEAPQVANGRAKDKVFLHLFMKDGETVRIFLWDRIAETFRKRWNDSPTKPDVVLITTVSSKTLGGAVVMNSTSSTRLFFDKDIPEITEFITWLGEEGNNTLTLNSSSSAITKIETVTIKDIYKFIEEENPQRASFICVATIVGVLGERGWKYISCTGCNTMLEKSDTTLLCKTCNTPNTIGVVRFRFEISVRDENNDVTTFVIFDQEGTNLTGRKAPDVSREMLEDGGSEGSNNKIPECILDIVGRTCKFQLKLTHFNFRTSRQTMTVSRIVEGKIDVNAMGSEETMKKKENKAKDGVTTGKDKQKLEFLQPEEPTTKKLEKRPRLT